MGVNTTDKVNKSPEEIRDFINANIQNIKKLSGFLKKIGQLPNDFDISWVKDIINHPNDEIRLLAVKIIGRAQNVAYFPVLAKIVSTDSSSMVKREAISSIGRMHSTQTIDYMISILEDNDPKIVCQAIRGLLFFKGVSKVDAALKNLKNHPNETVSKVIQAEYFGTVRHSSCKVDKRIAHSSVLPYLRNVAVNGDVLEVLKDVPDGSVHLTFTSPPYYNARDYSIYESYEAYLKFLEDVFKETYRVTKEGRFLIVNTSPVIIPRVSRAYSSKRYPIPFDLNTILQKMGWEFIDDIIWMKPEYSVKNRIGGFQQHRKPLGYKPNCVTEYLMVYRKSTDRLIDWNIHQYPSVSCRNSRRQ